MSSGRIGRIVRMRRMFGVPARTNNDVERRQRAFNHAPAPRSKRASELVVVPLHSGGFGWRLR